MKIVDFFFASRPMLHLPVWSVYLVSLYYHCRLSGDSFRWVDIGMMACLSLLVSGAYYINQIYDFDSDLINKKLGFLQENLIRRREMYFAFFAVSVIAIGFSLLFSLFTFFLFVQFFLLGYVYSASPFRLKDRPFAGLVINAYSFGWLVPFAVMPDFNMHNAGLLGWDNPLYFFCAVASVHVLTTIPDLKGDMAVGKKTIAVVLKPMLTRVLALVFLILAAFIAYKSGYDWLLYIAVISAVILVISFFVNSESFLLLAAKLPILLLTILAGYFFWGYLLFIVALLILTRIYYKKRFNMVYPKIS